MPTAAGALTNWAGNVTFTPAAVHRPSTLDEVRTLASRSRRWRVLGSGHSFSPLAATSGDLVSLADLPGGVEVDADRRTASVPGGATYATVAAELDRLGWALPAMASLPHISVAGACATGTHGSGDGVGCLATAVRALDVVVPGGDLLHVDRDGDPDFPGHVVSLGALGAVVRLTLDVVPTFRVRQDVYDGLPADVLVDRFDEVLGSAYSVSAFTDLRGGPDGARFQVWRKARVDDDGSPLGPDGDPTGLPDPWLGAGRATAPRHPLAGMDAAACTEQLGAPGPWHERLPHFRAEFTPSNGDELQSEFLLPRSAAGPALMSVLDRADRLSPLVQTLEIRTVKGDDLWLSPAHGRDTVGVHLTWVPDTTAVLPALRDLHAVLDPLGARPHWGKVSGVEVASLASRYPCIDDMRRLVAAIDPAGAMGNDTVDPLLRP